MADENIQSDVSATPIDNSADVSNSTPVEEPKLYTQAEVNRFVAGVKKGTQEKLRAEYEAQRSASQSTSNMGGMPQISQEDLRSQVEAEVKRMAEQLQNESYRKAQEEQVTQVINDFQSRIQGANEKFEDFEQKVADLDIASAPNLVPLTLGIDNTVEVLYELANNPMKAYSINEIANKNPRAAQAEINKLSESIKRNSDALSSYKPNEPLSQLKPSRTATDNGSRTVSDLRKLDYLRG